MGVGGAQVVFTNHKKERKGLTTPSAMFTLSRLCAFSISCQRGFLPAAEHWARLVKRASNYSQHARSGCARKRYRGGGERENKEIGKKERRKINRIICISKHKKGTDTKSKNLSI